MKNILRICAHCELSGHTYVSTSFCELCTHHEPITKELLNKIFNAKDDELDRLRTIADRHISLGEAKFK